MLLRIIVISCGIVTHDNRWSSNDNDKVKTSVFVAVTLFSLVVSLQSITTTTKHNTFTFLWKGVWYTQIQNKCYGFVPMTCPHVFFFGWFNDPPRLDGVVRYKTPPDSLTSQVTPGECLSNRMHGIVLWNPRSRYFQQWSEWCCTVLKRFIHTSNGTAPHVLKVTVRTTPQYIRNQKDITYGIVVNTPWLPWLENDLITVSNMSFVDVNDRTIYSEDINILFFSQKTLLYLYRYQYVHWIVR